MTNTVHNTQVAIRGIEALATQDKGFTTTVKIKINALITLLDGGLAVYTKVTASEEYTVDSIEALQRLVSELTSVITEWPENGAKEKTRIIKLINRAERTIEQRFDMIAVGEYIM